MPHTTQIQFLLRLCLPVILFLANPGMLPAQVRHEGRPVAGTHGIANEVLQANRKVLPLSEEQMARLALHRESKTPPGEAMHAGFSVNTKISPATHGIRTVMGDSLEVWQVMIETPGAVAAGLILKDFELPENGRLFIYDPAVEHVVGSFTHEDNNRHRLLSAQLIPGDCLVVEYQEGPGERLQTGEFPVRFTISEVIHITHGGTDKQGRNLGNAEWCHVDVNCSEGDRWSREKRGIARMLMRVGSGYYWCSGSLVNNTRRDGTPYFLTADHCGSAASYEDYLVWQFYFNLEYPECSGTGLPSHNVLQGATFLSQGPLEGGSDFKLLQLKQTPPLSWRPYYNGWNRVDEPPAEGVGIHHPGGDAKKISTYTQAPASSSPTVSGNQMADDSAWRLHWTETENGFGVTQGGSSGSPLFNADGLIVGTLTGGSTNCNNPNNPDFYGKLSYHWDQNGEFFYDQLEPFLDPGQTGVTELAGYDPATAGYPPPGFVSAQPAGNGKVDLLWYKPGHTPNNPGWHGYSHTYDGAEWNGPERATLFQASTFGFSYPATITKVSHLFFEAQNNPWPDDEFRFKVYDHTAQTLLYQSPRLQAEHLTEIIYTLEEPLVVNDRFYVAVDPVHPGGQPASLFVNMNQGNGVSFHGHRHHWEVAGTGNNQRAYLTRVYIAGDAGKNETYGTADFAAPGLTEPMGQTRSETNTTVLFGEGKWGNAAVGYNIYKNNEPLHHLEHPDPSLHVFSFTDETGHSGNAFDTYHVTALYPDGRESQPSNIARLAHVDFCNEAVQDFPHETSFEEGVLPHCWTGESAHDGWMTAGTLEVGEHTIAPYSGDFFAYVEPWEDETTQSHWLVSPPFDISEVNTPALSFRFAPEISSSSQPGALKVFVSANGGSFNEAWHARQHPAYRHQHAYAWHQAVTDLSRHAPATIRIAFVVEGKTGTFNAIDNIVVQDAAGNRFPLTLEVVPSNRGEAYGSNHYIAGEQVSVYAEPNAGYHFHYWVEGSDTLTSANPFEFLMPDHEYHLKAFFDPGTPPVSYDALAFPEQDIRVYPNPSRGIVQVGLPGTSGEEMRVTIYNTRGRKIAEKTAGKNAADTPLVFDLRQLAPGPYFIRIRTGERDVTKPLLLSP